MTEYTLDEPASDAYDRLVPDREGPLVMARRMAELTIPSLMPPDGYRSGDELPGTNSSTGADCVNNLASALMFTAFPPGRPMLRYQAIEHRVSQIAAQDPQVWSRIRLALSRLEVSHRQRMEVTPLRSAYTVLMKQLIAAGNSLWQHLDLDEPCVHRMDTYVVKRSVTGKVLLVILKQTKALAELDDDVRQIVESRREANDEDTDKPEWEDSVDLYTVQVLRDTNTEDKHWCYWQEYDGVLIPGTGYKADFDDPPLYAAWLIPVYGSSWGRSYCEEYRGDLYKVENMESAMTDLVGLAALGLIFVDPAGVTNMNAVKEAENLAVMYGRGADVTTFQLAKSGDIQALMADLDRAERRLARAFMRKSSIQRDAERVTAEEWIRLSVELDRAMGGLYSELAQSVQKHVVTRFVRLHEDDDKKLPQPPQEIVRVAVVTGIDAMGATTEEEALVTFAGTLEKLFGEKAAAAIDLLDFARRLAAEKGLQPEGLVKTEQQMASEQQAQQRLAMQRAVVEKGTGPAITAGGPAMIEAARQQQQQQRSS